MHTRISAYQELPDKVLDLLPAVFQQNNNIIFLISQINQNLFILNKLNFNPADRTQYQLFSKTILHLESIHDFMLIKTEDTHEDDPHFKELNEFRLSCHLQKIGQMMSELEKDKKQLYPFYDFESKLKLYLSNFQSMRVPSLKLFYEDIQKINALAITDEQEKLIELQQAAINYYYLIRKISWKIERWLFRKSRETKLGNSLEQFINEEILLPHNIKLPHKVTKTDCPLKLKSLMEVEL